MKPTKQILSFRVQVPANTLPASPMSLDLSPQLPIIKGVKIFYSPSSVLSHEVGFRIETMGGRVVPAMGSNDGATFSASPDYSPLSPLFPIELNEIDYQIPGAPYNVNLKFINSNAAAVYVFGYLIVTAKIILPALPIENDKLEKKEK
jgi:hypothetical protein